MVTQEEYDEARANWDSMPDEEKEEFVEDLMNDTLDSYGSNQDVELETKDFWGEEGSDDKARYKDGVVTFDDGYLGDGDFEDVMETAFHETGHAMQDPDEPDWYKDEYEDDAQIFAEEEAEKYNDIDFDEEAFAEEVDEWAEDNMEKNFLDRVFEAVGDFWEALFGSW